MRSRRSNSALEGYHVHVRQILSAGAISCGERWLLAVTALFDHWWDIKHLKALDFISGLDHHSPQLFDSLYDIAVELQKTDRSSENPPFPIPGLQKWPRTPKDAPVVPYGLFPDEAPPLAQQQPEPMGPRVKVDTWFERVTGNKRKTDWTNTADVMGALMHPQDMINGNASSIAEASGVVSSPQELGDKAVAIASMEKVYGVLDARGYGQVQQRHRHPGPAQPVAEPTPAQPMAHSEPLPVLLPHSSATSVLTDEAESSTVPEDQPEPQQTKSQIRDAKRKRLRDRTTGTKSEQDAEIERYGQWLDRKKKKKRKAEADAEE